MDFLQFLTSLPVREVSSTAALVGVVALILTGRLVPRRHLNDTIAERDAWRAAHEKSEEARMSLRNENFKLLETARISDQFYRDFLPAVSGKNAKVEKQRSADDDLAVQE